jgi:type IV pilus assembly protein PilW
MKKYSNAEESEKNPAKSRSGSKGALAQDIRRAPQGQKIDFPRPVGASSGLTLIELMVSITIGLLILLGLTAIAVNNIRASDELERSNQQVENGRYAMQLLTDDLRNAGYFAEFNLGLMTAPAAKPDPCDTTLAGINAAIPLAIQGYDNGANAPSCISDVKANTDILVVRRVSTCAVGDAGCDALITNAPYFQASACGSTSELGATSGAYSTNFYALDTTIGNLTRHKKDCTTIAPLYQYYTRIYYIANNDKASDGIPTLKRAEIGNVAAPSGFTTVSLVQGVDNLQIEYGLDNPLSHTGSPAAYTADPDSYNSCSAATTPTCAAYWQNVVAAKVHLLARNTTPSGGYSSTKTYVLGLNAAGNNIVVGPFSDNYKRHVYNSTVRINNTAGRNTP